MEGAGGGTPEKPRPENQPDVKDQLHGLSDQDLDVLFATAQRLLVEEEPAATSSPAPAATAVTEELGQEDSLAEGEADLAQPGVTQGSAATTTSPTAPVLEPMLEAITGEITSTGAIPEQLIQVLITAGWASPQQKAQLEANLSTTQGRAERTEAAVGENIRLRAEHGQLVKQTTELKDRITELQRELAAERIKSADTAQQIQQIQQQLELARWERTALNTQIEALQTQIGGTTAETQQPTVVTVKPIIEPTADTAMHERFRIFCDGYLGRKAEAVSTPAERAGLSDHSRQETQTTFLERDKSEFNPRYGMYRMINSLFGNPISVMGDPAEVGEEVWGTVTLDQAQQIGEALEILSRGNTEGLIRQLREGLVGAHQYYHYGPTTDVFFVGALPELTAKADFKKNKFFLNAPKLISTVLAMEATLREMSGNQREGLLVQISQSFTQLANSSLLKDLQSLVSNHPDIFKADYSTDLEDTRVIGKKASDVLIEVFKKNPQDCVQLTTVGKQLAILLPPAHYHKQMTSSIPIDTRRVTPGTEGNLVVSDARNPYAVLLSTAIGGRYLGAEDSNWYRYFRLYESVGWPPNSSFNDVTAALSNEQPISLSIDPDKPIILLTGNNGAGKTRAMETVAQTVANALVTGTNSTARILKLSKMREIRSLVGASRHTVQLSSFQREATLIAEAIETLSDKPKGERAILIVDEVGKGTDSRDAISLMLATAEYCRRNNIYLLMATHHGKEFVSLASKLGLRSAMTIMSPDFGTHQLHQYEEPVSSKGVEVMQTRARKHQLPDRIANILYTNALLIRQAVIEDTIPRLHEVKIDKEASESSLAFADDATLQDLGLYYERTSYEDTSTYTLKPLQERVLRAGGVASFDLPARKGWEASFLTRWGEVLKLDETGRQREQALIKALVEFARRSPDTSAESMKIATRAFEAARVLFNGALDSKTSQQMDERYKRFVDGDLITSYLEYGPLEVTFLNAFLSTFEDRAQRAATFEQVARLGESFASSGTDMIAPMGKRILSFAKMQGKVEEIIAGAEAQAQERFITYMRQQTVAAIRNRLSGLVTRLSETDVQNLAGRLNEPVSAPAEFFEGIAKRIEAGDSRVYGAFFQWLIDGQSKQSGVSTEQDHLLQDTKLLPLLKFVEDMQQNPTLLTKSGISAAEFTADFPDRVIKAFCAGDVQPIFSLARAASRAKIWLDYQTSGAIVRMVDLLNYGKFFAWQKFVAEQSPYTDDAYAALGITEGADDNEIKAAFRRIARENHQDMVTPVEWRGKDSNSAPTYVQEIVRQARVKYDQATSAHEILSNPNKRSLYDRDRDVKTLRNLAYYTTIVHSIIDLNWAEATYSDDGRFELGNSLAVGLISKTDPSEIVRQSLAIDPKVESVVIGGSNGNGKSQLLVQLASAFEWARATGFVPAESAVLPKVNFIACMINAGESTEGKSSFQNEIDRYINLFDRYVKAGCPTDGIIFLDEPLAGTSSEDQIGILLSMIEFFRQRRVKVIFTNHNYKTYEFMRRTVGHDGSSITFKPVAFMTGKGGDRFRLSEFSADNTSGIRSDGIRVAGECGLSDELIQIALFARDALTGKTTID